MRREKWNFWQRPKTSKKDYSQPTASNNNPATEPSTKEQSPLNSSKTASIINNTTKPKISSSDVSIHSKSQVSSWSSESLWSRAYESLRLKNPALITHLEELNIDAAACQRSINSAITAQIRQRNERQWIITLAGRPVKIRECGERLIKFVDWSKDIVSSALATQPHVALAWSGVTMILPVLMTPSAESDSMIQGLDQIATLLRLYDIRVRLCPKDDNCDDLKSAIIVLYSHVLEYQISATCHLSKSSFVRGGESIWHAGSWQNLIQDVNQADQDCQKYIHLIDTASEREHWALQNQAFEKSTLVQKQILEALRNAQNVRAQERDDDRLRDLLQCLAGDYLGHKNVNERRVPQTCDWFLQNDKFVRWKESTTSTLLWVSAGPGCGKSVLSRSLIDENLLTDRSMTSTICYFFFKNGLDERDRAEDALSAILHQIYSEPMMQDLAYHAYPAFKDNGKLLRSMFHRLWQLLVLTSQDPAAGEIICLLDALDECEEKSRLQLIDALVDFYESAHENGNARIKFLITSRPYQDIGLEFNRLKPVVNYVQFAADDESETISKEINRVIEYRVPRVLGNLGESTQTEIIQHLQAMQHRTYLWLYLVLDVVKKRAIVYNTAKKVKVLIQDLPSKVSDAYEEILKHSPEPDLARIVLQIVISARTALTVSEIQVAVAIATTKRPTSYDDLGLVAEEIYKSGLPQICGLFINIVASKVFLIHQTAREFLFHTPDRQGPDEAEYPLTWQRSINPFRAEYLMAQICVSLLYFRFPADTISWRGKPDSLKVRNCIKRTFNKFPFLEYASLRWHEHFKVSEHHSDKSMMNLIVDLCKPSTDQFFLWYPMLCLTKHVDFPGNETALIVASTVGLREVALQMIKGDNQLVNTRGGRYGTALITACSEDDYRMVKLLLDNGADPNVREATYGSALGLVSHAGYITLAQMLLQYGADVNANRGLSGFALGEAVTCGHLDIVKLLVHSGASIDRNQTRYGSALAKASYNGQVGIAKFLLESGADLNLDSGDYGPPLTLASSKNCSEVLRLLLERGANVNAVGGHYGTALAAASCNGHLEIVQILLEAGADTNIVAGHFGSALGAASSNGQPEIVQLILESGVDVNTVGGNYGTALGAAACSGKSNTVQILLENGGNVNARAGNFGSALGAAAFSGQLHVIKQLLDSGADINANGGKYGSALAVASAMEHVEVVTFLLDRGADIELRGGEDNLTAFQLASLRGAEKVAKLLFNRGADPGRSPLTFS